MIYESLDIMNRAWILDYSWEGSSVMAAQLGVLFEMGI